jgi:hypothetical protein
MGLSKIGQGPESSKSVSGGREMADQTKESKVQRKAGLLAPVIVSGSGAPPADRAALAATVFSQSDSVALPGPRSRGSDRQTQRPLPMSSADGPQLAGALSTSAAAAVRGCSLSAALAASRAIPFRTSAAPDPRASEAGAAGIADIPAAVAVGAPQLAGVPRATTNLSLATPTFTTHRTTTTKESK